MKKLFLFALTAVFAGGLGPAFAQSSGATAAMPTCASGDPVVWENTKSKKHVYHMSGDKYYGKSKQGKYVCQSQAKTDGYHAAGAGHGAMSDGATSAAPSPAPSGGMSMGKHHHHHHMGMPSPAPSPAAS